MLSGLPILVTGGSSPLGDIVLPRLMSDGATVTCIVRSRVAAERVQSLGAIALEYDLTSPWPHSGYRASEVIHLAGISHGRAATQIARSVGADHMVAISSASATIAGHPNRDWIVESENALAASEFPVSILRPTMIYGGGRDRNVKKLDKLLSHLRRVPHFSGGGKIMPVLADDVASAIAESSMRRMEGKRAVGGNSAITLGELVDVIADVRQLPRLRASLPLRPLVGAARLLPLSLGKNVHALQMLLHDRIVPTPVEEGFFFPSTNIHRGIELALSRYD